MVAKHKKILVVYDSLFGNTQKVAKAIGEILERFGQVTVKKVTEIHGINKVDLMVVGTPVHGGRPSQSTSHFLAGLPAGCLTGVKVAGFDTRMEIAGQKGLLKVVVKVFGSASGPLRKLLEAKGAGVLGLEGFVVEGKEGPLKKGELDRAREWAATLLI